MSRLSMAAVRTTELAPGKDEDAKMAWFLVAGSASVTCVPAATAAIDPAVRPGGAALRTTVRVLASLPLPVTFMYSPLALLI